MIHYDRTEWLPDAAWASVGLEYRDEIDFESGQMLIHKSKNWRALRTSRWINEHSDRYYAVVFGDKSTFHLGWRRAGSDYVMPSRSPGSGNEALLQYDRRGKLLFEHCVQNKPTLQGFPHPKGLSHWGEANEHLERLKIIWDGTIWQKSAGDADQDLEKQLEGKLFRYIRIGIDEREIRLVQDNRIGRGHARLEEGWAVVGGRIAITGADGKLTVLLEKNSDNVWRGQWLEYERCDVEMIPR